MKLNERVLKVMLVAFLAAYWAFTLWHVFVAIWGIDPDFLSGATTILFTSFYTCFGVHLYKRRWTDEGIELANSSIVGMGAFVVTLFIVGGCIALMVMLLN